MKFISTAGIVMMFAVTVGLPWFMGKQKLSVVEVHQPVKAIDGSRLEKHLTRTVDQQKQITQPAHPELGLTGSLPHRISSTESQHPTVWYQWLESLHRNNFAQLTIANVLVAEWLHTHPQSEFYEELQTFLADKKNTLEQQLAYVDLLREIATPEALQILLKITATQQNSPIYVATLQNLARIGDNRWGGKYHVELSPLLEAVWLNSSIQDQAFYAAIGQSIAKIGASSGVQLLFDSIASPAKPSEAAALVTQTDVKTGQYRQTIAFASISKITNPQAVPILADYFRSYAIGNPEFEVSGMALARIGTDQSVGYLVDYLSQPVANAGQYIQGWTAVTTTTGRKIFTHAGFADPLVGAITTTKSQ